MQYFSNIRCQSISFPLRVLLILLLIAPKAHSQPPYHPVVTRSSIIQEIHMLVNHKRSIMSMEPLILNDSLSKVAQAHSDAMAAGIIPLGHDGFAARSVAIQKMFPAAGGMGENVTLAADAEEAVELWWTSEGHQANMTGAYNYTGLGAALKDGFWFCTQIFIQK